MSNFILHEVSLQIVFELLLTSNRLMKLTRFLTKILR